VFTDTVVLGVYLLIEARTHPASKQFIQGVGITVIVCGLLVSYCWRFIAKLATEGLLILADIADGFFQQRKAALTCQMNGTRQKFQG